jgi:dipeptide/tripeptide permease
MTADPRGRTWRPLLVGLLAAAVLGFGLAGLCGAAFTVMGVVGMFQGGAENYSVAILVFSVPSLVIGGGLALGLGYRLARRWRQPR